MSSSRNFNKQRKKNKLRNPVVVLLFENPSNKTESMYFKAMRDDCSNVVIHPLKSKYSDPINMLKELELKEEEYKGNIDKAYVVTGLDVDEKRANKIKALVNDKQRKMIVSNPCFEIWYLNHFTYTTRFFESGEQLKKTLTKDKYIPGYTESLEVYSLLKDKVDDAISNSKKQIEYGKDLYSWPSKDFNPRTDVYRIIETIKELEDDYEYQLKMKSELE